jgi:glycosyltransferase involved in cell wall biosynthesis
VAVLRAFAALAARRPGLRLKIVCDAPLQAVHPFVENKQWTAAEELADLRSFTIGIMPLDDDPWTRGKCGVKILQYFASARPVVASPVGENLALVREGENGFLARTANGWRDRLADLLDDRVQCMRLGAAGRRWLEAHRSVATTLDRLIDALE